MPTHGSTSVQGGRHNIFLEANNGDSIWINAHYLLLKTAVKQTVLDVIEHGSVYDVDSLDKLYSDNMHIVRVTSDGRTNVLGKRDVLNFFQSMRSAGAEPLCTEAQFNHIETGNDIAHVVVTRNMKLFGEKEKSVYSLCLAKDASGWKVVKETVVSVA